MAAYENYSIQELELAIIQLSRRILRGDFKGRQLKDRHRQINKMKKLRDEYKYHRKGKQ